MTRTPGDHPDAATLDRYRTAELDADEGERVAQHLAACASCARALADLEGFSATVGRAYAARRAIDARAEPDWGSLRARIAERTAADRPADRPGAPARARRSAWLRWAPQAAAAVLALVVIGVLWREGVRGPSDARRVVEPSAPGITATDRTRIDRGAPGKDVADGERATLPGEAPAAPPPDAADARFRAAQPEVQPRAPAEPAPAAEGEPALEKERDEVAAQEREGRADGAVRRAEAQEEDMAAAAGLVADPLARFEAEARAALARSDTLAAARALALWRDTLAPREAHDPARRRAANALADSLAALIAE